MKRFLSAFLIFAAILITGCSDSSAFGKLTLKIDSKTASKIEQAAVSRKLYNETEILLDINILGDYTASKTVAVQDGTKVEFYDIPAGAQVYAEATARLAGDRENTPLLHGTSEKIIIHEEENFITLELQKTEQQIEQKKYRIEVMQSQNGTVTPDCTEAEAGTTVKLTVSPEENYQLVSYQVKNESNGQEVPVTGESFIMPEGDVKVYAYFEQV